MQGGVGFPVRSRRRLNNNTGGALYHCYMYQAILNNNNNMGGRGERCTITYYTNIQDLNIICQYGFYFSGPLEYQNTSQSQQTLLTQCRVILACLGNPKRSWGNTAIKEPRSSHHQVGMTFKLQKYVVLYIRIIVCVCCCHWDIKYHPWLDSALPSHLVYIQEKMQPATTPLVPAIGWRRLKIRDWRRRAPPNIPGPPTPLMPPLNPPTPPLEI